MKRSVILLDRLGPNILSAFWTKGQVLHRERAHLKVPGFSIVLNVPLTRKLPTFLSRFITSVNSFHPTLKYTWEIIRNFADFSRYQSLYQWQRFTN